MSLMKFGCSVALFMLGLYFGVVALLAIWTDRSIDFWASHIKGAPVDVSYWWSFLISILAPIAFIGNVVTEILRTCV